MYTDHAVDALAHHFLDRFRGDLHLPDFPQHPADWAVLAARYNIGVFLVERQPPFVALYADRIIWLRHGMDGALLVHGLAHELTHGMLRTLPEYADVPEGEHHRICRRVEKIVADATGWLQPRRPVEQRKGGRE